MRDPRNGKGVDLFGGQDSRHPDAITSTTVSHHSCHAEPRAYARESKHLDLGSSHVTPEKRMVTGISPTRWLPVRSRCFDSGLSAFAQHDKVFGCVLRLTATWASLSPADFRPMPLPSRARTRTDRCCRT